CVERLSVLSGDFVIMAFSAHVSAHGCPLRSVTIAIAGSLEVFADRCGLCRWSGGAVVDEVASTLLGGDLEEFDQQTVGSGDHGEPSSGHRGDVGDITTACPEPVGQCVQIFDEKTDVVEQVSIMSGRVLRFEEMDPPEPILRKTLRSPSMLSSKTTSASKCVVKKSQNPLMSAVTRWTWWRSILTSVLLPSSSASEIIVTPRRDGRVGSQSFRQLRSCA